MGGSWPSPVWVSYLCVVCLGMPGHTKCLGCQVSAPRLVGMIVAPGDVSQCDAEARCFRGAGVLFGKNSQRVWACLTPQQQRLTPQQQQTHLQTNIQAAMVQDEMLGAHQMRDLWAVHPGKPWEWVEFPEARHMDAHEVAPAQYWPAVTHFIHRWSQEPSAGSK